MKILMIAPQPFFQPRGTPFSVLGRLKALSELGHQVDLLTYHIGKDVDLPNVQIIRIPSVPFIKKIKVGPSLAKIPVDALLFWLAIKKLKAQKYDLLHTHEEAGFMGILLKSWFGIPHLYDMHSSLPQQLVNFRFSRSRLLHAIFSWLEQKTIESADGVITICPDLYNYVEQHFEAKNHILIENVVDYSQIFGVNGKTDFPVFVDPDLEKKVKVVYVGTFEPYQGIDLLIDGADRVIARVPDAHFILVGGREDQVQQYRERIRARGLSAHFTLTGSVSPAVAHRFTEFADILVSPRISGNNTPLKIYSYLRSGKPVIATRHITHTQVLDDRVAILTEPEPEAFAAGIVEAITDAEKRRKIVENARRLAEEKYSYRVYLNKIRQLIDNITKQAGT